MNSQRTLNGSSTLDIDSLNLYKAFGMTQESFLLPGNCPAIVQKQPNQCFCHHLQLQIYS